eukprot:GHVR01058893.1.p1 GENE.GHVR01058893.1~~GHVR01058893.1.p1  ORF type:complete len:184 (+),score=29.55 GHVR01058893.1:217-768(+)
MQGICADITTVSAINNEERNNRRQRGGYGSYAPPDRRTDHRATYEMGLDVAYREELVGQTGGYTVRSRDTAYTRFYTRCQVRTENANYDLIDSIRLVTADSSMAVSLCSEALDIMRILPYGSFFLTTVPADGNTIVMKTRRLMIAGAVMQTYLRQLPVDSGYSVVQRAMASEAIARMSRLVKQ